MHVVEDEAGFFESLKLAPRVTRRYPRGVDLLLADVVPPVVLVLQQGLLKLVHVGADRDHILDLQSAPALVGAPGVVANTPLGARVTTATTCLVGEIPADQFLDSAKIRPELLWWLYQQSALELCSIRRRIAEVCASSPRQRLLRTLSLFVPRPSTQTTRDVRLHIPITRREVAQLVGVTPEYLSRLLHQLEGDTLITRRRGWIIVRDVRRLTSNGWSP
jgi:CRP-like cAMP-binding protein